MDPITLLGNAKKVWDLAHLAGGTAIKNDAGQKYIAVQGATGNALISIAEQQDTIDEILVGIVGDVVQGLLLNFTPVGKGIQVFVGASSIISGEGLGNELKEYYKLIKADDYEYWDYVKNWHNPSTTVKEEYAKILMRKNADGTYAPAEKAPGIIYSKSILVDEYNKYIDAQNAFYEELYKEEPQAQIENSEGVLKVTMPTGEVISEGDYSSNDIFGNDKNDYLYGNDGQDNLIGYGGSDELNGGTDNDTLVGGSNRSATDSVTDYLNGGTGYDTYYAGANDVITDTDGLGSVYFAGDLITGTEAKMTDKSGYIYKDANYTYKLTNPNGIGKLQILKNGSTSQTLLINNFNATTDEYLGIKLDKTPLKEISVYLSEAKNTEGSSLLFDVEISEVLNKDIKIELETVFGSADSLDLQYKKAYVTILAGRKNGVLAVQSIEDTIEEETKTFSVKTTGNYTYARTDLKSIDGLNQQVTETIVDDDNPDDTQLKNIEVSIGGGSALEGEVITFYVGISGTSPLEKDLYVAFMGYNGTSENGDFFPLNTQVRIPAGTYTTSFNVQTLADDDTDSEVFYVQGVPDGTYYSGDLGTIYSETAGKGYISEVGGGDSVTIAAGSTSTTAQVAWGSEIVDTVVDSDAPIDVSVSDFYYFGDEEVA